MSPHWSLLIRLDQCHRAAPPPVLLQTWLACSHSVTMLINLNKTQSSVLLLSEGGLCLWATGRDSGCWVCWTVKEEGWGREEMVRAPACSFCENQQWHHCFPTRKEKNTEIPCFSLEAAVMQLTWKYGDFVYQDKQKPQRLEGPEYRASQLLCTTNSKTQSKFSVFARLDFPKSLSLQFVFKSWV